MRVGADQARLANAPQSFAERHKYFAWFSGIPLLVLGMGEWYLFFTQ
jgi:hypothetical protein